MNLTTRPAVFKDEQSIQLGIHTQLAVSCLMVCHTRQQTVCDELHIRVAAYFLLLRRDHLDCVISKVAYLSHILAEDKAL